MPSVLQVAKDLGNKHLKYAPKANQYQIKHVINIYEDRKNVPRHVVEKTVMALYMPSAFGRVGKRGKLGKADEIYEDFRSRCQNSKANPEDDLNILSDSPSNCLKGRISKLEPQETTNRGSCSSHRRAIETPTGPRSSNTRRRSVSSKKDPANTSKPSATDCCNIGLGT